MFVQSLRWPIWKPWVVLAAWTILGKKSLSSPEVSWVGAEGIPGNATLIANWRHLGIWHQWLLPPYQTRSLIILATLTVLSGMGLELQTSWLQAKIFHYVSRQLTFQLVDGPATTMAFSPEGPLDERQGYTRLPLLLQNLQTQGFAIQAQAQASPQMMKLSNLGVSPVYQEKGQAGLQLLDQQGTPIYRFVTPNRVFANFEAIPPLLVKSLLFIENRELLDPCCPYANPALEWDRLGHAFLAQGLRVVHTDYRVPGASTLATQLEKFQHSPGGQTSSLWDKAKQVTAASLRIYQEDVRTLDAQKQVILRYINSFPLGAYPGAGEIHGLGDGLWVWYGTDLSTLQAHLAAGTDAKADALIQEGLSFKKGLSLFLALRRPAYFLQDSQALNDKTNLYLRLLTDAGILPPALRDIGLQNPLVFTPPSSPDFHLTTSSDIKATNFIRTQLQYLLDIPSLYDLDHLDLSVHTTLDHTLQAKTGDLLRQLADPTFIAQTGLNKPLLLSQGNPEQIIYSLTLYERTPAGNLLRVQTDTLNQPLDMNQGSKTDLGSTAKLRTLVTYLEVIERLFNHYHTAPREELQLLRQKAVDPLTHWALTYLEASPNHTLPDMLEAAMERRYSANPHERFWTGGGLHEFANFNKADNRQTLSVRQAFYHSVNLVFVRLMRDLVQYYTFGLPESPTQILSDRQHPLRKQYLQRFAQQEGRQFLQQFHDTHHGQPAQRSLQLLMKPRHRSSAHVGMIIRSVYPDIELGEFSRQFRQWGPSSLTRPDKVQRLFQTLNPADWSLGDQGYLAGVHPLELFTVQYLAKHPQATKGDLFAAAEPKFGEVYAWLFAPHRKYAQDQRIRTMLEQEAFQRIHRDWQRMGYPFSSLVPSLATAIGSSADRPSALAQLMGILANDGHAMPDLTIERVHFAKDTPFETILTPQPSSGTQVLNPAIAKLVKRELIGVVNEGTARSIKDILNIDPRHAITIGGKTGTGDHQQKHFEAGFRLVKSSPVSRTATFVFLIDNRFFGTITAQVLGPESGDYDFTSSLPVNIFRLLAPHLKNYFDPPSLEVQQHSPAPNLFG